VKVGEVVMTIVSVPPERPNKNGSAFAEPARKVYERNEKVICKEEKK